jgi:hypothetical protein
MSKIKAMLQDDSAGGVHSTEMQLRGDKESPEFTPPSNPVPPVMGETAPPPMPSPIKSEMVKVYKATADIAANTEITKDLLAHSFTEKEVPKETFELLQAYGDLTPYLGQVFNNDVVKDQLLIKGMIGPAKTKVAPPDVFVPEKAKPEPKPEPEHKPVPAAKRTHDMAGHTATGTTIYRFEEVAPGDWRLKKTLTPEEAARDSKQPGASDAPANPTTPEKPPEAGARKID